MRPRSFQFSLELIGELIKIVISQPLSFLQVDRARLYITEKRLQEAKEKSEIKCMNDSDYSIKNTVRHNLESLDPKIAFARPMALLGPLLGVDSVVFNHANLKVLIIGPRTEAEILLYISRGFSPNNIYGLDLITYSEFISAGDMHNIPFSDNFFDIVVFSWVLGYSCNQKLAVQEARRVSKPNGLICIGEQWDPMPIDQVSAEMERMRGYSLEGTVTNSASQLIELVKPLYEQIIFSNEPLDKDKDRVGLITCIARATTKN